MAKKKSPKLSVGRGEKLPASKGAGLTLMEDLTFPNISIYHIGKDGQIYSESTKSGLHYVYGHFTADTHELFYIGLGKFNRCNQLVGRNKYWTNIKNKHGVIVRLLDAELSQEDASEKESYFIRKYQPRANMTIGGEAGANSGLRKKVYAYNKDGSFFRAFDSISDANVFFGSKPNDSRISRCLSGIRQSFSGVVWRDEFYESIPKYTRNRPHNARKVYRYDLDGNFIESYDKINEVNEGTHSGISISLDTEYSYLSSFWRTEYADKISVKRLKPALKEAKKVLDTQSNKVYPSITSAAKELGCGTETLRRKLIGDRKNNTKFILV